MIALNPGAAIYFARADIPPGLKTPADLMQARNIFAGGISAFASKDVTARLTLDMLGLPHGYLPGYAGTTAVRMALEKGEVNFYSENRPAYQSIIAPLVSAGAVLPLWIRDLPQSGPNLGRGVGRLLTWNTLGAVAGTLVTGFVLMPRLGLRGAFLMLAHEWANTQDTRRSYELISKYVMPRYQGQAQATLDAINGPKREKTVDIIVANMERWRWIPRDLGETYIMVNIPDFTLRVVKDDKLVFWTMHILADQDHGDEGIGLDQRLCGFVVLQPRAGANAKFF